MKLSTFAEAMAEGWHAFRVTLFAKPPKKYQTYYANYEPKGDLHKGDIWITDPDNFIFVYTGRRWKELKEKKNARS